MSEGILSITELAEKYKLKDIGPCNCDGHKTEQYTDGYYKLKWRKYKYVFQFKSRNEVLKDWTPVKYLQEYLETFFEKLNAEKIQSSEQVL